MADSPYAQLYALTQQIRSEHEDALRLRAGRPRPRAAGTHLRREPAGAPATRSRVPFDTKTGYCQQFSGAMALMLRMGGVPARVASGFTPGQLQQRAQGLRRARHRRALVGRGLLPALRLGHLRPDARRVAGRARSSTTPARAPTAGRRCRPTSAGAWGSRATARSRPATPAPASRRPAAGGGWKLPVGAALVGPRGAASAPSRCGAGARRSRRSRPELAELQRALHRSGRDPSPDVTLRAPGERARRLATRRARLRARACATAATRARRPPPTAAQRRALRRQLGSGLGLRGALRAWWALPPLPRGALKDRLRRPYTPK